MIKRQLITLVRNKKADPIINLYFQYMQRLHYCKENLFELPVSCVIGMVYGEAGELVTFESVLDSVKEMSNKIDSFNYGPVEGAKEFRDAYSKLVFQNTGANLENIAIVQTPGGSGALSVAFQGLKTLGVKKILFSDPTWNNHYETASERGLKVGFYEYLTPTGEVNFDKIYEQLSDTPTNTAVLIQPFAHNPTGMDFSVAQLEKLAALCKKRGLIPVLDVAYTGYGEMNEAEILNIFLQKKMFFIICSSCSKAFTFYNMRLGACIFVTSSREEAEGAMQLMVRALRTSISTSATLPARVVTHILTNPTVHAKWRGELLTQKIRIKKIRASFFNALTNLEVKRDFSGVIRQVGLFSFLPITPSEVIKLREEYDVWIVPFNDSFARLCVASLNVNNLEKVAYAISQVCK